MKFFLDTEFIEDGRTIDLLSIGVVAEDGREFYREVHPDQIRWSKANDWVLANVRPHLSGATDVQGYIHQIALELVRFVGADPGSPRPYSRPEFWAYYADYDWVAVCQLFGKMIDLPAGWPMFCMDLKQLAVSLGDPPLPEQTGIEHHALADALWNRDTYLWLQQRKESP